MLIMLNIDNSAQNCKPQNRTNIRCRLTAVGTNIRCRLTAVGTRVNFLK